jgi:hypothetical protein
VGSGPVPCPVPAAWIAGGVPEAALAAFAEGTCPVHGTLLVQEVLVFGGPPPRLPLYAVEAGWCGECRASWHMQGQGAARMLTATWTPAAGEEAAGG